MFAINILLVTALAFIGSFRAAYAYPLATPVPLETPANQVEEITKNINRLVEGVLEGFAPGGAKKIINQSRGQLLPNPASNLVSIPKVPRPASNSFINFDSFSTNDLVTPLKAVITLLINLFFIVIQVVLEILKAMLGAVATSKI